MRDPDKTARNKIVIELSKKLKALLPIVLEETGFQNAHQLHAYFATRKAYYIDLKQQVVKSPEHYVSLVIKGLKADLLGELKDAPADSYIFAYDRILGSDAAKYYMYQFHRRTFFREYENITKVRPNESESEIWIGQNNADYGVLISPRFRDGEWSNDRSEIRRFRPRYWSIGHVLSTGLVIPDREELRTFDNVGQYLQFFRDIVRQSASPYQRDIADLYSEFVLKSDTPEEVLLLIPELRFQKERRHKYRLDFCIIDVETRNKVGFEFSPWSTHGKLTATKGKTQKAINEEALANFEKEMTKHKDYFRNRGIFTLIYTDSDLRDIHAIFAEIQQYLLPENIDKQLEHHILFDFFGK